MTVKDNTRLFGNKYPELCDRCDELVLADQGFYHGTRTTTEDGIRGGVRMEHEVTKHVVLCQRCQAIRDHEQDKAKAAEV